MKKIIILRGNSGSGKTTVARALQKKFGYNTMMISQDEIRRNILWVKDGVDTKGGSSKSSSSSTSGIVNTTPAGKT